MRTCPSSAEALLPPRYDGDRGQILVTPRGSHLGQPLWVTESRWPGWDRGSWSPFPVLTQPRAGGHHNNLPSLPSLRFLHPGSQRTLLAVSSFTFPFPCSFNPALSSIATLFFIPCLFFFFFFHFFFSFFIFFCDFF